MPEFNTENPRTAKLVVTETYDKDGKSEGVTVEVDFPVEMQLPNDAAEQDFLFNYLMTVYSIAAGLNGQVAVMAADGSIEAVSVDPDSETTPKSKEL